MENQEVLSGKEVDKSFDNGAGNAFIDVDAQGGVKIGLSYNKDLDGFANVKAEISADTNIFKIASKIAEKTATPVDDALLNGLKQLLGIK